MLQALEFVFRREEVKSSVTFRVNREWWSLSKKSMAYKLGNMTAQFFPALAQHSEIINAVIGVLEKCLLRNVEELDAQIKKTNTNKQQAVVQVATSLYLFAVFNKKEYGSEPVLSFLVEVKNANLERIFFLLNSKAKQNLGRKIPHWSDVIKNSHPLRPVFLNSGETGKLFC